MSNELFRAGCWHDLIFEDGDSSKFWSIKIHKNTHIRKWGPIGQDGRELVTEFSDAEEARSDAERLFKSKTKAGYRIRKPQLKVTTELVHFVDYGEFERFITSVYNVSFEFVFDQECGNDSTHRFCVTGNICDYDKQQIKRFVDSGDGLYMASVLLEDCVRQRLIPAGTYVIEVCW